MRFFSQQKPGEMAVITTYFNVAGYKSFLNNYRIFAEDIRSQNLDLWTVEIAFDESDFELPKNNQTIQIRARDVMWHKERAFNILIKSLPRKYENIAWLDADILFENRKWAKDASKLLEKYLIVQCFDKVHLYKEGNFKLTRNAHVGYASQKINPVPKSIATMHPGYAWAGRRSFLEKHLLYDRHILGANDFLMALAFFGYFKHPYVTEDINESTRNDYLFWGKKVFAGTKDNVGYLEGDIYHLWHGKIENRQYIKRDSYLLENDFNPETDIKTGSNGLFEWSSNKPAMHQGVRQYFFDRNDDGSDSGRAPCLSKNLVSSSSHLVA